MGLSHSTIISVDLVYRIAAVMELVDLPAGRQARKDLKCSMFMQLRVLSETISMLG